MEKRRVVITGMGAVTPIGNNVETFWKNVKEGKNGIGSITKFDTTDYKVKIAAEVKDFSAKELYGFQGSEAYGDFFHSMRWQQQRKPARMPALILRKKILIAAA